MKSRIISAAIILAILIPVLIVGGIVFDIFMGILASLSYIEFINIKKNMKIPKIMKIIGLISVLLLVYINIDTHSIIFGLDYRTLSLVFLLMLAPSVFLNKKGYTSENAFYLSCITILTGTIFSLFISLYNNSIQQFIFIVLIATVTDIFALFGGKLIGKHKLTPISPKKTIEGSIVGTVVAIIICTTYYITVIDNSNIIIISLLVCILSIIGQIGDLFFSLIKRENDQKDFSNLIPGHGGILDRIDSIIFILVAFTFLMRYL